MKRLIAHPSKATIIIVHGAFEHSGRYETLAEQFQKDGFTVIYGDLPGQGRSKGRPGHINSFEEYIQTVDSWLSSANDQPVFLLGHSMGGTIAIRTMEKLKPSVQGVILSSPAVGVLNGAEKPLEAIARIADKVLPKTRVKSPMLPEMVTRNQKVIARDKLDSLILDKVSIRWYREFKKGARETIRDIDSFPDVPLLVMQAGDDKMVDISETKAWFNKVDVSEKIYKQWPQLYHELYNEPEWEEVYDYTLSFIEKQLK